MVYNKFIVTYSAIAMPKPTAGHTTNAFSSFTVVRLTASTCRHQHMSVITPSSECRRSDMESSPRAPEWS